MYLADSLSQEEKVRPRPPPEGGRKIGNVYIPNGLIIKKVNHGPKDKAESLPVNRQVLLIGA